VKSGREDREFEELLLMLKETRGFDFTGYKRATLIRRIQRRMNEFKLTGFGDYRDYLELAPEEFGNLFDSLLINVTSFFRDPPAWQSVRENVLPALLAAKGAASIRVWSAGCATGQEAYSLAMVLAETLGADGFRERVKIYATDLDEVALRDARAGVYTARQLLDVPEDMREKYFEPAGAGFSFLRDLRRQVIFGRNDLTKDAPISRVDLLVARNTLMYFNTEAQRGVVRRFHFALTEPGYLFLGKAEMLLNQADRFEAVDLRKRLFRKVGNGSPGARSTWPELATEPPSREGVLEAAALAAGPVAHIAVDLRGILTVANARAETMFDLRHRDIGRPFQDLEVSYRPLELRSVIEQVMADQRPVDLHDVVWKRVAGLDATLLDIAVVPLSDTRGELVGVAVSFADVTRYRRLRDELEHANHDLERAYEELQALNEELETTNEELQSTNEELETTNEELQSTNEELETMNEDLQSTNDELQEINDALRVRTEELDSANGFLATVLRSLGGAVVVLDEGLRVLVWSPGAEELWGVRAEEATTRPLASLDIGLPGSDVTRLARGVISGSPGEPGSAVLDAVNRRGRPVRLRVEASLLRGEDGHKGGVLLVMDVLEDARG
jgi:two-component system CheB/CheR fusion protein